MRALHPTAARLLCVSGGCEPGGRAERGAPGAAVAAGRSGGG